MKIFIFALVILLEFSARAEAELVCYAKSVSTHPELPVTLCLTHLSIFSDGDHDWVLVFGGNMEATYDFVRRWDKYGRDVGNSRWIFESQGGEECSSQLNKAIVIDLDHAQLLNVNTKKLKVSIQFQTLKSTCQSGYEIAETIPYKLKK